MYQTRRMSFTPDGSLYRTTNGDRLLAGVILAMALGAIVVLANHRKNTGTLALIHVGAAETQVVDLSLDQVVTHRVAGYTAQFEVHNGRIRMREVTCPQKLCQHRGWISRSGETIVCVPNSIMIEITGSAGRPAYDALSY